MGDFNMLPSSLAHQVITTLAPVKDVWKEIHPDSSVGAAEDAVEKARKQPVPTAEYNIKHNGASCDGPFNTWRWPKKEQKKLRYGNIETDGSQPDPKGKRLDYIFIGDTRYNLAYEWVVQDVKLGMMERHPTLHCSLSDHFSIEATIVRSTSHEDIEAKDPRRSTELKAKKPTLEVPANPERNRATSSDTLREINDVDMPPRANTATDRAHAEEMYNHILRHIEKYVARERFQRRFRIGNFFLGLLVAIGCFIAEWWSPRDFVAFILCF
ncbi:phospholipase C type enzyme, partial [Ascosphaera atra]